MSRIESRNSLTLGVVLLAGVLLGAIFSGIAFPTASSIAIAQGEAQPDLLTDYVCYQVADTALPDGLPSAFIVDHINPSLEGQQQSIRLASTELFCTPVTKVIDESAPAQIFINEFESNPEGADAGNERIELFNPSSETVDLTGWTITATAGIPQTFSLADGTTIPPTGLLLIFVPIEVLNNTDEVIELRDANNVLVDSTADAGPLSDDSDSDECWARVPNGSSNWVFQSCTLGASNQ